MTEKAIRFSATVYKVQTLVDGGLRLTLDLPEDAIEQVKNLMICKKTGALLEVAVVAIESENTTNGRKIHI